MKSLFVLCLIIASVIPGFGQSQEEVIDRFAQFPGGAEKFYEYIKANLKYPADARKDSITGIVFVEFKVDSRGVIVKESVKVIKGLSSSCDDEALRLIKNGPSWTPAESQGKDVEQAVTFPVNFILD
jgi:TonB family protein